MRIERRYTFNHLIQLLLKIFLEKCKAYWEAFFFGLPIIVLPSKDVEKLKVKTRNEGKYIQYNATELLDKAIKWLPDDAYWMLWIMNKDIYNREDWNYVFGLGHPKFRTDWKLK